MTTDKQIQANRENAKKSTGPKDTSKTRINAVTYGLTGETAFSEQQELMINELYADLDAVYHPENKYEEFLISRMAIYMFRLQRAAQIEENTFVNSFIEELKRNCLLPPSIPEYVVSPKIDTPIDLILRYETITENRLLRLAKHFQEKHK